ncbi:TetR/AcrR family transcriptional regulator [Actinomadura sp. B10D3]|uniref:TetR/AcrR family transcriptional regulator n=1 Tax=Actinomadura sp. B10D3 TaxID=3153557 RepID=UPI00325CB37C
MASVVSRQEVIDVATRLFSELGYDGTSVRLIADAVGVTPATITEVAGDKRAVYLEVMRQAFEAERVMLDKVVSETEPGRGAVHHMIDAYLDFHLAHPHNRLLWAHRWVADAADITELEDRYARPLMHIAVRQIRDVVPPDVNPFYMVGTMVWCVHGYLGSGLLQKSPGMRRSDDPRAVASFRTHMHVMMDRLLTPRDPGEPDPS